MIKKIPDFLIKADTPLSRHCRDLTIVDFHEAVDYIFKLPYRRNSSKEDLTLVLSEECGVCSTKHATLAALALENDFKELKLMLGVYQMNEKNTPGVGRILEKSKLEFIPEAHTYLVFENEKIDITREVKTETSPFESLLLEIEIQPSQIGEFKVELHRDFLEKWILENDVEYSLDEIWKIREDCISALVLG
ncbi:MAG: hypothetical protein P8M17_10950 [Saprospiraceae bacterium]|nr:hypothetical protein [Saprospiraceae bacterium]MDG2419501.1 hypothetical protein [Saprospiraceae bacterium]